MVLSITCRGRGHQPAARVVNLNTEMRWWAEWAPHSSHAALSGSPRKFLSPQPPPLDDDLKLCLYVSGLGAGAALLLPGQVQRAGGPPGHLRPRPLLAGGRQQGKQVSDI